MLFEFILLRRLCLEQIEWEILSKMSSISNDSRVLTSDNSNCEPLISINDVKAEGGNDENNVDIKLFVGTDT